MYKPRSSTRIKHTNYSLLLPGSGTMTDTSYDSSCLPAGNFLAPLSSRMTYLCVSRYIGPSHSRLRGLAAYSIHFNQALDRDRGVVPSYPCRLSMTMQITSDAFVCGTRYRIGIK